MNIPTSNFVLADLGDLPSLIRQSLKRGTLVARQHFSHYGKPIDRTLAGSLARWGAKDFLEQTGQQVEELDTETVQNIGLALYYGRYHVRIWRSDNGLLPVPGESKAKQEFYSQQMCIITPKAAARTCETSLLNVAFLWDADSDFGLQRLQLACPRSGGKLRQSVEPYWQIDIPEINQMNEDQKKNETTIPPGKPDGERADGPLPADLDIGLIKNSAKDGSEE